MESQLGLGIPPAPYLPIVYPASGHVLAQSPPLLPMDVRNAICFYNSIGPNRHMLVVALLVGFFTLLRQSNLFYSHRADDPGHALRACDITITCDGLCVRVRSSKKSTKASKPTNTLLPVIPSSPYCPVLAWFNYVSRTRPFVDAPAFLTSDGSPLTARAFIDTLRLALSVAGHPLPSAITGHSLQRGAAQACALEGSPPSDIR